MRLFFQDESRFGLITEGRRKITLKGVKPIGKRRYERKNFYLYGAIEPKTGENLFLELPELNSETFQIFLNEMGKQYPHGLNLVYLDRGSFHWAANLKVPNNIRLQALPPYSPELNPIERIWQEFKREIAWEDFEDLEALSDWLSQFLQTLTNERIQSITNYSYIQEAFNA